MMTFIQVHGGTSFEDINRKVIKASELALKNTIEYRDIQTVLFFDEANTTDAIGLIKEIMCDHTIKGSKTLCNGLKLIAACNPYRK